jgi:hypothetical protein
MWCLLRKTSPGGPFVKSARSGILLLSLLLPFSAALKAAEIEPAVFLRDYRASLRKLESQVPKVQFEGVITQVFDRKDGSPPVRDESFTFSFARLDGRAKYLETFPDGKGFRNYQLLYVSGDNGFALRRGDAGAPFILDGLGSSIPHSYELHFDGWRTIFVDAALAAGEELLPNLVASPAFVARNVTRTSRDGVSLVKVEFDYLPTAPKDKTARLRNMSGWLLLDPAKDWAVVEHEVHRFIIGLPKNESEHRIVSGKVSYVNENAYKILPQNVDLVVLSLNPGGKKFEQRFHFQLKSDSVTAPSPEDFRLSAYGLDDVTAPHGRSSHSVTYWSFGIAVIAIIISVVTSRLARRASGSRAQCV